MTWLKIDDQMDEHHDVVDLSNDAFRLNVSAMCYCSRKLTDGHVPDAQVTRLMSAKQLPRPKRAIAQLLEAGLWHTAAGVCRQCVELRKVKGVTDPMPRTGYLVHNFLKYNPPRWRVLRDRAEDLARKGHSTPSTTPDSTGNSSRIPGGIRSGIATGIPADSEASRIPYPVSRTPKGTSSHSEGRREGFRPLGDTAAQVLAAAAERSA